MNHEDADLTEQNVFFNFIEKHKPDYLINLAAFSGNLNFNQKYPSKTFEHNTRIGLNVFGEWFKSAGNKKAINVIPSCSYPDYSVLQEENLWNGACNSTIESHGLARRCIEAYTRQLNKEGAKIITCIVNNSYGPGDSFNPEKTKVIGGLINKFVEAKESGKNHVVCWGTGAPLREFIYCDDVAECLLQCLEGYNEYNSPVNIASGQEISIKDLSELIAKLVGFDGDIFWDKTKPDGQLRKKLLSKKMDKYVLHNFTPIEVGLKKTIDWYYANRNNS